MKRRVYISQMTCSHCESKIKNALNDIGATDVNVNLEEKIVEFNSEKSNDEIIEAISDYGFDVDNIE